MIKIEIRSNDWGVGKSTVAAIINCALERCGYEVDVKPVPFAGHREPQHWSKEERRMVKGTIGDTLLDNPDLSYPQTSIELIVHG